MSFYEEFERVKEIVTSGDVRPDLLTYDDQMIYELGTGKVSYNDLSEQGRATIDAMGGPPSMLGRMGHEAKAGFQQMQEGIRQNPIYDAVMGMGRYDIKKKGLVEPLIGAVKGGFNIPMGFFRMWGAPSSAAATTTRQAAGLPDWTQLPLEIGLGIGTDIPLAKVAKQIPRGLPLLKHLEKVLPSTTKGLKTQPETTTAKATAIDIVEGTPEHVIPDLPRTLTQAEELVKKSSPLIEKTPYNQALREFVEETIQRDPSIGEKATVLPLLQRAEQLVEYLKSPEYRAFAADITEVLRSAGMPDEAIVTFLKSRARSELFASEVSPLGKASQDISRQVQKLAQTNPRLAVLLDEAVPQGEQLSLFGRTVAEEPTRVVSKGATEGSLYETGRNLTAPGQVDQRAVQLSLEIMKTPVSPGWVTSKMPTQVQRLHNLLKKSLVAMVGSPYTATRNMVQQALRSTLEIPVGAYEEILAGGSVKDAMTKVGSELGSWFSHKNSEKYLDFLSPEQVEKLQFKGMYGETPLSDTASWAPVDRVLDSLLNKATAMNRRQEKFFWLKAFEASVNSEKAKRGLMNLTESQLPSDILDAAYNHANEMTYSRDIMWKGLKRAYKEASELPIIGPLLISDIQPFPRFNWGNALVDLLDFSPVGFYKAVGRKDTEAAARAMGKAVIGSKILSYALSEKEVPKGEWWQVNLPGFEKPFDVRRWHPLGAPFLMAELYHRPMGSKNARVTFPEVVQMLSGINRIDDTMVGALVGMLENASTQNFESHFNTAIGNYLSRWTQPLRWGQLAEQLVEPAFRDNPESWKQRDVLTNFGGVGGMFDRSISNIPIASNLLPPRIDPTTKDSPGLKDYWDVMAKLTGLDPIQTNRLKSELTRLKFTGEQGKDFLDQAVEQLDLERDKLQTGSLDVPKAGDLYSRMFARTGDRDRNRILNEHMSKVGSELIDKLLDTEFWQDATDPERSLVMSKTIDKFKGAFKEYEKEGMSKTQAIDKWLRDKDPFIRRLLDEKFR
jgi:hypothetical protein